MASSIYSPLHGDGCEFRLLFLEPSPDRLAPVLCELKQASFDDGDLEYTALSYTWGDPLVTTPILVNGVETQVTLNLEAALRHIRRSSCVVVLWVDALCINQIDGNEKSHQVERMREIYSGAELVIAWLGTASEDSDLAMEILGVGLDPWFERAASQGNSIQEGGAEDKGTCSSVLNDEPSDHALASDVLTAASELFEGTMDLRATHPEARAILEDMDAFHGVGDEHRDKHHITDQPTMLPPGESSSGSDKYTLDAFWDDLDWIIERLPWREAISMTRLLTRSWWSRIWVVQEVLLAKRVVFKCGDAEVTGEQMRGNEKSLWCLTLWVNHDSILHYMSALELLEYVGARDENKDAVDYLFEYGSRQATRPHDHVYGLFGIIPKDDQILLGAPDYDCGVEDLFIRVATKLMLRQNSLALLDAAASTTPAAASSLEIHLPSWVPDWTRPLSLGSKAAEGWIRLFPETEFQISEDSKELMLEGFEIGKIESVKPFPALAQGKMPIWQNAPQTKNDQQSPPLQRILVALSTSVRSFELERLDSKHGFEFVAAFLQELEKCRISVDRDEARVAHNKDDYLAGFLEWTDEIRDGRTDEEILEKVFSVQAAHSFVKWYQRQSTEDLQRFYTRHSLLRTLSSNQFMFRTDKGSFGITENAEASPGDILCVVPSCQVPFLFRRVQSSKHVLIGSWIPTAGGVDELARAVENGEMRKEAFTLT